MFGHTHTFFINEIDNKWYINTGSLGCPLGSNIAKAGLLEINNVEIKFKSINVKYNVKEIIDEIYKLKFPFYKEVLRIFYGIGTNEFYDKGKFRKILKDEKIN